MRSLLITLFVTIVTVSTSFSQTGPGGVGNASGANSQPVNVVWLKGDVGLSSSAGLVDSWADQSGNSNNAIGTTTTRPTYTASDANFNNLPTVTFPNTGSANFYLQIPDNDNLDNTSQLTVFYVVRPTSLTSAPNGILSKRSGASVNSSYVFEANTSYRYRASISTEAATNIVSSNSSANQIDIFSFVMNGTAQNGYYDGANNTSRTSAVSTVPNNTSSLFVGSYDNTVTTNFEGAIAEVIIYTTALNTAQRQIVENYLSAKYNSALTSGDVYAGDNAGNGNYDFDLAGIGFNGGTSHLSANSKGLILTPSSGTINVDGEFVLAAHNGTTNAVSTANLGTGGVIQRWARAWYIDRTPASGIDVNLTFDFSEGINGEFPQNKNNYVLLRLNGANYDVVTAITSSDKTLVGDQIIFRVADANLVDGVYTLGTLDATNSPVNGVSNKTWYSYQSGNWTSATSWTLDGGLFPNYVNPSGLTPSTTDNVEITSGRTITMNTSSVQINSLEVVGTLDLGSTTGHNFLSISGSGRIKMSGSTDNFPSGTTTNFADASIGGTVEVNGTAVSLNTNRTFRNLDINLTSSASIASLESNYTLNGDLTITNGIFKINNDVAVSNRTLTVYGDINITSSGGIRTGTTSSRHELNLYGDFTNDGGTAYFTQRTTANTAADATDGIVDFNLLSSSQDQSVTCNGVTRFYRIEITKGTDDSFKATLSASAAANFNLFGRANYDINEANAASNANGSNLNALGLNFGTVEIGTNVSILVNTVGNYSIYEGARLWVNGGSVTKTGGNAIVPYGTLRVSAGSVTVDEDRGLTLRDSGVILVEGGTVTARCVSTSTNGASAVGSYIQSGGNVILTGNNVEDDYAVLSLTYTSNVFNMSGGTLTIQSANNLGTGNIRGVVFINSDPGNVSITGGTVIFEADQAFDYRITSRSAFWNVTMRSTGGSRNFYLLGTTSGTGGGANEPSLAIQPLTVLNDFTIEGSSTFTTTNANVTVSGNVEIQNTASYVHGTNTTTITGAGVSSLIFGNTAATQTFNNLTINKTAATDEVTVVSGNSTALRVNGTLTVTKGILDYAAFSVSARNAVTIASDGVIGKAAATGKLILDGTADQTLSSSFGSVYNMEINNTDATPVITLATDGLYVLKTLTLTSGIFNINSLKLSLNTAAANVSGSGFSATKMIQTSGNASDEGLEFYVDANESLTYPIGVSGKYTPATITTTGFSDDGYVTIRPVSGTLQTTNLSGGSDILSFYWRVSHSGFTVKPSVTYQFTYATADVAGTEANYVPGKVLDESPFTRSFENDVTKVNDATNVITFNGSGSGFSIENANYTAGATTRFSGTVRVFYTRTLTDAYATPWTTTSLWTFGTNASFGVHDSRQTSAGTYPVAGDIAVIGWVPFGDPIGNNGMPHGVAMDATFSVAEIRFTQMLNSSGNPTARAYYQNFQFRPTLCLNNSGTQGQIGSGAKVSGEGMFWIRSVGGNLSDPSFTGVDLGAFNAQDSSYVVYENTLASATYVNTPTAFPNLMMATDGWGDQDKNSTLSKTVTVNGDLELLGDVNLILATGATGDITVNRNLRFFRSFANGNDSGGGGILRFGNTGTARTITIFGNLVLGNGYAALININSPGSTPLTHTINLSGNFFQNTTSGNGFKAGTSSTQDRIHMNLTGSSSMTLTSTSGDAPQFYSLTVNKGSSIATTAQFDANFTISGPTGNTTKSLVLSNGLFIINNASASVVLTSGGADFNIPSTAGLEVRAGSVSTSTTSTNASVTLDGLLKISGGSVSINGGGTTDSNYIEYSNSGNATIEITSGSLTVAGQVRRNLSNFTGVLKYRQSGGTVLIGNESASSPTRGVFEVLNTGSEFSHSGGSFTIVRGINSTTIPSLWLEPASSTITSGSTITIGNASTPSGVNSQNIGIQSTSSLNNLTIAGSNNPVVKIYTTPLTVNGVLTVGASTTFNANYQNLTVGGDFTVNGSYVPTTATTTLAPSTSSSVSGSTPLLNFYNLFKSSSGTVTLGKDITVLQDLDVASGTLATSSYTLTLKRHAEIDGIMTSTSGTGLYFAGTSQQQLRRSAAGTSSLGIVTIANSSGVIVPDGNDYNFGITTGLRLTQGVFDIGGGLLSLSSAATIVPVNAFSITNMIQTNSSFTDKGVRKQFPLNYTTDFVFPVGQLAYTPVTFNFSASGNTTGSTGTPTVTVRPANEIHPSVVNDNSPATELPSPAAFNDLNNVLQYHWIINADNVASTFRSTMTLAYQQSLVSVVSPYTEADYLAARILLDSNPSKLINKYSTSEVDETLNTLTFNFVGVTDAGISGEYFAGVDVAIPDNVPIYTTTSSGNVNAAIYTPVVPGGGAPEGATVIVSSGHNLNFNLSNIRLYETQINANATLTIPTGSTNHRLGTVTGTGTLRIESNTASAVLPAAVYDDFFACTGGGLAFGGTGSYEIMGGILSVRQLTLDGAGTKTFGSNDVTICNDLNLNAGLLNTNARTLTIQNDFNISTGTYNSSTSNGVLSITRDLNLAGTFNGGNGGLKTVGRNLTATSGTLTPGSGSTNVLRVNGNMNVDAAVTITTGTGGTSGQKFLFGGVSGQTLTGTFTGTRAFNRLEIDNSAGLTLAGNTTISSQLVLTSGNITPGTSTMLMESSATSSPTDGRSTSFVNGKLYKVMANGSSFTFPVGKSGRWRSAEVNTVSQTGSVTWDVEYFASIATGAVASAPAPRNTPVNNFTSSDITILTISRNEYWKVSDGSSTSNGRTAKVGLSWGNESDVSASLAQREALKVMSWNGINWSNHGGTSFSPGGTHTQSRGSFLSTGTLSFSENIVTLGSTETANALPVTLAYFRGKIIDDVANLYWQTLVEKDNDRFEIQHSVDGVEFATIGYVSGAGTSVTKQTYSYEDQNMRSGLNYYRLRQVDFNGASAYTQVIALNFASDNQLGFEFYPNPTTADNIAFAVDNAGEGSIEVQLVSLTGKIVNRQIIQNNKKYSRHSLQADVPAGVYILSVTNAGKKISKRIVILR